MTSLHGIFFKIGAVLVFIVMVSLIKVLADTMPPGQIVFFRSLFAMPVILLWLAPRGEIREMLHTNMPWGHVGRGTVGVLAMGLTFAGLAYLPLPEVTAIGYAAPLLTVIFAAFLLGERVGAYRLGAVILGLFGVLIVLSPRLSLNAEDFTEGETLGAALVLSGAVFAALAQVFVRKLVATETTSAIVFWFSATAMGLSLLSLPFGWVIPTPTEALLVVLVGLLGGFAQILLTTGFRWADASVIAPFDYVSILFAMAIGYWVFSEVPTLTMIGGATLVVFAGMLIIWRERQLAIARAQLLKAAPPNC